MIPMSGSEAKVRINKIIRKSDACIVALYHVSLDTSNYSHKIAKVSQISFKSFDRYGEIQFLTATYKSLGI